MNSKSNLSFFLILITSALLFFSCRKEKTYPVVPVITFKSVSVFQPDSFKIKIGFTDGDGDIGFRNGENPSDYNCFIHIFERKNGVFVEPPAFFPYYYRIPNVTPDERNKNITGDIDIGIRYLGLFSPPNDTVRIELHIVDRALHESNTIVTEEFILFKQ